MTPEEKRAAALRAAQDVIAKAKTEARDLTVEEVADLDTKNAEITEIDASIQRSRKSAAIVQAFSGLGANEDTPVADSQAKSLGEFVAKSIGAELKGKKGSRVSVSTPEFKAASDVQSTYAAILPALTTVDTNIVIGVRRRLTVADLLGTETISGNSLTYFIEGALEGAPTSVGQGGHKPQIHYGDLTPVTESLMKIAAFLKESDEIIEDAPWLASAINGRLVYNLGVVEEDQLLGGAGGGYDLTGILHRAIQSVTSAALTDDADSIFRATTKVFTGSGLQADGLVINPSDYQTLRLMKDGNEQYYGGGFFQGQYGQGGIVEQPPVWGLRTVVTPAIPKGTALVGAFKQAASVIRKGGVRVEVVNTNDTDFEYNRVTVRAEERLALAVRVPFGFCKVTLVSDES